MLRPASKPAILALAMLVLSKKQIKYRSPKIGMTFKSILVVRFRSFSRESGRYSISPEEVEVVMPSLTREFLSIGVWSPAAMAFSVSVDIATMEERGRNGFLEVFNTKR